MNLTATFVVILTTRAVHEADRWPIDAEFVEVLHFTVELHSSQTMSGARRGGGGATLLSLFLALKQIFVSWYTLDVIQAVLVKKVTLTLAMGLSKETCEHSSWSDHVTKLCTNFKILSSLSQKFWINSNLLEWNIKFLSSTKICFGWKFVFLSKLITWQWQCWCWEVARHRGAAGRCLRCPESGGGLLMLRGGETFARTQENTTDRNALIN